MHKITDLPTGVVGIADTNPHSEKSTYKAPKVTTVQFYVEVGLNASRQITGTDSNYEATEEDGNQTYFGTRSF